MARIKFVCSRCKSDDVCRDAWARWDEAAQQWQLSGVYDHGFCNVCDGESHLDEVELDNQEAPAPRYTLGVARTVSIDDKESFYFALERDKKGNPAIDPDEMDKLAHEIVRLLNECKLEGIEV
jgi:hypothetical protein